MQAAVAAEAIEQHLVKLYPGVANLQRTVVVVAVVSPGVRVSVFRNDQEKLVLSEEDRQSLGSDQPADTGQGRRTQA